ncbi:MAG: hypothetical protein ACRD2C_21570, partial [Acidimicrobiales bacterium]
MKAPRVRTPATAVFAGLVAAALMIIVPSVVGAQEPEQDPVPPVTDPTVPTAPSVPEIPEMPEMPELPAATTDGAPALGSLAASVLDTLSGLPEVPVLSDLLRAVLELLVGLL